MSAVKIIPKTNFEFLFELLTWNRKIFKRIARREFWSIAMCYTSINSSWQALQDRITFPFLTEPALSRRCGLSGFHSPSQFVSAVSLRRPLSGGGHRRVLRGHLRAHGRHPPHTRPLPLRWVRNLLAIRYSWNFLQNSDSIFF